VLLYKKYAFDYFDSILCSGPHQIVNIRKLEEIRGLPEKKIFKTGCTYYDLMLRNIGELVDEKPTGTTVLVAPTWGKNGCLTRYGAKVLRPLLDAGYHVILRPHPQMFKSEAKLLAAIVKELESYSNVEIDLNPAGERSMTRSDILVSDISGIIFDYAFLFQKPVLVIDGPLNYGGYEAEDVDSEIWELSARNRIGRIVEERHVEGFASNVEQALKEYSRVDIRSFRDEYCYNFGRAGEIAADQLVEILRTI
jgi:CDP-glycerol glycerophosphotransferase (TagB/SpsB family)